MPDVTPGDRRFLRSLKIDPDTVVNPTRGVAFTAPPTSLMAEATRIVTEMAAQLPPGAKGGVIGVATEGGWNAAIVHRAGEHVQVASWIGKSWSGLTGGAAVRATW